MKKIDPRKKASQTRSQITFDSIVEAAGILLKEHGLKGLTTNKIVEKAGVSIGSLYQYFPGKEAILAILLEKQFKKDLNKFKEYLETLDPEKYDIDTAVKMAVTFFMTDFSKHSKIYRELMYSIITIKSLSFTKKHDKLVEEYLENFLNKYKENIKPDLDISFLAFFLQYTVKGLKFGITFTETTDYNERITKIITNLILNEIKAK